MGAEGRRGRRRTMPRAPWPRAWGRAGHQTSRTEGRRGTLARGRQTQHRQHEERSKRDARKEVATKLCSCMFSPTAGKSSATVIPCFSRISLLPIPDSSSSCGVLIELPTPTTTKKHRPPSQPNPFGRTDGEEQGDVPGGQDDLLAGVHCVHRAGVALERELHADGAQRCARARAFREHLRDRRLEEQREVRARRVGQIVALYTAFSTRGRSSKPNTQTHRRGVRAREPLRVDGDREGVPSSRLCGMRGSSAQDRRWSVERGHSRRR